MKFATVRELKNRTSELLRLAAKGRRILVTLHGKPVAMIQGMSEEALEDYLLSHHPALRASIEEARRDLARHGSIPLERVIRELKETLRKKNRTKRGRRVRR